MPFTKSPVLSLVLLLFNHFHFLALFSLVRHGLCISPSSRGFSFLSTVIAPKKPVITQLVAMYSTKMHGEARSIPHDKQRNIKRFSVTFRNADDFNHMQFL